MIVPLEFIARSWMARACAIASMVRRNPRVLGRDSIPIETCKSCPTSTRQCRRTVLCTATLLDPVLVMHDAVYLDSQDLTAVGYSDKHSEYRVSVTPTMRDRLDPAMAEIKAPQEQAEASKAPAANEPVVPARTAKAACEPASRMSRD